MRILTALVVLTAAVLSGCANINTQVYRGRADGRRFYAYVPPEGPVQIYSTNDFARDIAVLDQRGYALIGQSILGEWPAQDTERQLRAQAEKIGAAAVLVSSRYADTVTGAKPLPMPNTNSENATSAGVGQGAQVSGSATETETIRYKIRPADYDALYFVKVQPHLGVYFGVIDDKTRFRLNKNGGALVAVVMDGSPAARADILPGDIILTFNGEPLDSPQQLLAQVRAHVGQTVNLGIDRHGQRIEKKVGLPD